MSNLLKDSIADAKNLKRLAMDNARMQLEESFIPRIQSIVSKKLREEEEDELEDEEMLDTEDSTELEDEVSEEEIPVEDDETEIEVEDDEELSEEDEIEVEDDDEEIEDAELEEIIKELEDEMADEEEVSLEEMEDEIESELEDEESIEENEDEYLGDEESSSDEELSEEDEIEVEDDDEDEEIDLEEIFGKKSNTNQVAKLRRENTKLRTALKYMSKQINEVSLLNSKLLYTNKLFRKFNLAESQKRKVINTFDRTKTLREVKLVYSSLIETFTGSKVKRNAIRESFASKKTASTRPNKLVENKNPLADRLKQLANIK